MLSRALAAFKTDLAARGIEQTGHGRVLRVRASPRRDRLRWHRSRRGPPDHVCGSAVKGGLAGEHPGRQRQRGRRPRVQTDFRTGYQSLISEWLGGDPTSISPGPSPVPGRGALRRRHHADEGRVAPSRCSRWLDGRSSSPSWSNTHERTESETTQQRRHCLSTTELTIRLAGT